MKINITISSDFAYKKLVKRTRVYMKGVYNKKIAHNVFEGKDKGYYAWIKNGGIQIEVVNKTQENIMEIQRYLEYMFHKKYIGISLENNQDIELKLENVKCFKL